LDAEEIKMAEIGLNPVDKETVEAQEKDKKITKKTNKYRILFAPKWIEVYAVLIICFGFFFSNYNKIDPNFTLWVINMTNMQMSTIFIASFILNMVFFLYAFAMIYFTRNIINKILWAKIRGKRLIFHRGRDRVYRFYMPVTDEVQWTVEGVGAFNINENAMGWLENGVIMMPTVFGHNEGVDYEDIKKKHILTIEPTLTEDRIKNAKLQAIELNKNWLNPQMMAGLIPLVMVIGIAGYLIINQLQNGQCQANLVQLAAQCGEAAKQYISTPNAPLPPGFSYGNLTSTTTTIVPQVPLLPKLVP
jgi:hypothetical protein